MMLALWHGGDLFSVIGAGVVKGKLDDAAAARFGDHLEADAGVLSDLVAQWSR